MSTTFGDGKPPQQTFQMANQGGGDNRLYSPSRDVAHNFKQVMVAVSQRIDAGQWESLNALLDEKGVTNEELGAIVQTYFDFVRLDPAKQEDKLESMDEALTRLGWDKLSETGKIAFLATLGAVISGVMFVGVREATMGGVGPALTYQELADYGAQCAKRMGRPKRLRRFFRAVGGWFNSCLDRVNACIDKTLADDVVSACPEALYPV